MRCESWQVYPEMVMCLNIFSSDTPWKFNIAPEGWWLQDYFPIGKVPFWGAMLNFGRVNDLLPSMIISWEYRPASAIQSGVRVSVEEPGPVGHWDLVALFIWSLHMPVFKRSHSTWAPVTWHWSGFCQMAAQWCLEWNLDAWGLKRLFSHTLRRSWIHCPFNCGHSAVYPVAAIQSASHFPWSNWHMMTWGGSRYLVPRPPKMRTRLTYLHFFPHLDHSKSTRRSQMYTWESHFSKHIGARHPRITYLSIATFGGVGNEQCSDQNQPPGVPAVHLRGKTYTPNSRSSRKRYGISNGHCKQR